MPAYLLSIPFIAILFLSFLNLQINKKYRKSSIYFLFSVRLLILAYNLFTVYGNFVPFLSGFTFYLTYSDAMLFSLSGPLFYIILLAVLNERQATSALNARHFWPMIPGLMFFATFSSLPYPLKMESFYGTNCGILPDDILYASEASGIIFYIVISITKINNYLRKHRGNISRASLRQLQLYSWFLHFSLALSIGYGILSLITPHPMGVQMIIVFFLIIQALSELLLIFGIRHAPIRFSEETTGDFISEEEHEKEHDNRVYSQKLDNAIFTLEQLMSVHKIYLNHKLDTVLLVRKTGMKSNLIKTSIKEKYSMTVPEFINMYRIEHAKALLGDTNSPAAKIDILAYDCGYSTRSNFYRAFKNATGVTPNEYRNSIMKNE